MRLQTLSKRGIMPILFIALISWFAVVHAQSEPVGYYDEGSLINAACLPAEGPGYMQLYRDVNHIWGTQPLVQTIVCAAQEMNQNYPDRDRLQVEEMSARNGGDVEGHSSHENGLDVDIQYYKADGREHVPAYPKQYAPEMVQNGRVSSNFDVQRNWQLLKTLHRCGSINQIFMDQVLIDRLKQYARSINEYNSNALIFTRMQHWDNHADHFHLRLNCPRGAGRCHSRTAPRRP